MILEVEAMVDATQEEENKKLLRTIRELNEKINEKEEMINKQKEELKKK